MPSMPGHVTKTTEFEYLDTALTTNPKKFEKGYDSPSKQVKLLLQKAVQDGVITPGIEQHVLQHWLGSNWPNAADVEDILQRGLLWAVRLSLYENGLEDSPRTTPLPIRSVWICAGPTTSTHFELTSLVSDRQVTLIFFTPEPAQNPAPAGNYLQPIWTTRSEPSFPFQLGKEVQVDDWQHTITVRPLG